MSTPEYKCQDCRMEFPAPGTCGQETTSEPECPMCRSHKVRKLTEGEMLARRALGSIRGG